MVALEAGPFDCFFDYEAPTDTVNPRLQEPTFSRARLKLVLISKLLRLISRYRGSYLKGALFIPLESLTKMFSRIIWLEAFLWT